MVWHSMANKHCSFGKDILSDLLLARNFSQWLAHYIFVEISIIILCPINHKICQEKTDSYRKCISLTVVWVKFKLKFWWCQKPYYSAIIWVPVLWNKCKDSTQNSVWICLPWPAPETLLIFFYRGETPCSKHRFCTQLSKLLNLVEALNCTIHGREIQLFFHKTYSRMVENENGSVTWSILVINS